MKTLGQRPPAPREKVAAAIERLWDTYSQAQKTFSRLEGTEHGKKEIVLRKEAERLRMSVAYVLNLERYGNPETGFSPDEIGQLCRLATKHRRVIATDLLAKLVSIPNRHRRMAFAGKVIREGWSLAQVDAELSRRYGRRKRGGRRPKMLGDVTTFLATLEAKCFSWVRLGGFLENASESESPGLQWDTVPEDVRAPLRRAIKAAKQLGEAVVPYLGTPQAGAKESGGRKAKVSRTRG
jgi:hypothetical protein